jgi:hypothetical protein
MVHLHGGADIDLVTRDRLLARTTSDMVVAPGGGFAAPPPIFSRSTT